MAPARSFKGIGGWLLIFLVLSAAVSALLIIALATLWRGADNISSKDIALGTAGVIFAVFGNLLGLAWLGREKSRGVPLAQRGVILTYLATIHLSVLLGIASTQFFELLLFSTGAMLLWILYFGLSLRAKREHIQIDLSRRIEATFPSERRGLPLLVRTLYTILIWAYAIYVATFVWKALSVAFL